MNHQPLGRPAPKKRGIQMSDISVPAAKIERAFQTYRVAFGVAAILAIVAGLVIIFWPTAVLRTIAIVIGIYAIGVGSFYLAMGIWGSGLSTASKVARIAGGGAALLLGILALAYMNRTDNVIIFVMGFAIGLLWLTEGVITLMSAIKNKDTTTLTLVLGIVAVAAGVAMIMLPLYSTQELLKWMFGISFIALGIAQVIRLYRVGNVAKELKKGTVTVEVE